MVVEQQLLPNPALKAVYDDAVWVYVYRDFTRKGLDHHAERISLRFGVTSWPQLFLADPHTLAILAHTGRTKESFLAAVGRTKVKRTRSRAAVEAMQAAEKRADEFEKRASVKLAKERIDDPDIVVRQLALGVLANKAPKTIVARAGELLAVPNDPFRYEVCRVLKEAADPDAALALAAVAKTPRDSLNPNVLRIRAVQALAACGDARAVPVIAEFARTGAYFNGLTGISVDALAAIAKRHRRARPAVRTALQSAYPPPAPADDARATRACVALAKRIHRALGETGPFPTVYDEKARRRLMR